MDGSGWDQPKWRVPGPCGGGGVWEGDGSEGAGRWGASGMWEWVDDVEVEDVVSSSGLVAREGWELLCCASSLVGV